MGKSSFWIGLLRKTIGQDISVFYGLAGTLPQVGRGGVGCIAKQAYAALVPVLKWMQVKQIILKNVWFRRVGYNVPSAVLPKSLNSCKSWAFVYCKGVLVWF